MSAGHVIDFLRAVAMQSHLLEHLKAKSKDEVITASGHFGLQFTESEFDSVIWDLEVHLASKRGEKIDSNFSAWQTMWGKYYLEFLAADLMPGFTEADFATVMATGAKNR